MPTGCTAYSTRAATAASRRRLPTFRHVPVPRLTRPGHGDVTGLAPLPDIVLFAMSPPYHQRKHGTPGLGAPFSPYDGQHRGD
jgi:hypothetical protein